MTDKLKQIIFKKLYKDLSNVEIIPHSDKSIWFINRDEKYWYLELEKSGRLRWRYFFFSDFFKLFSLEQSEYEPLIMEWVEEVLNGKVVSSNLWPQPHMTMVEEVLVSAAPSYSVEEVLNGKVASSPLFSIRFPTGMKRC